jgi:sec-independent protein translocase protein TatA
VSIGPLEIVIVLVLALLVFGPKGLPQAGRSLGQAMREFRKATQTARTELGLDEVAEGVKDLKSSMSVDLGLNDIKSSMSVDLKAATAAATVVAPPADKPVPVAAAGSDTTPLEAAATEAAAAEPAAAPAVDEPPAADTAGEDATATGAPAGRDDA